MDPAKEIAHFANNDGVPTICNILIEISKSFKIMEKLDAVTCLNTFAHCEDMNEFFDAIKNVLKPDGVFIFEVSYL